MKIEYITGNLQKFEEAQHILSEWELEQININLTEIQGDIETIIQAKAKEALRILHRPLIVEDVSLCCEAIGGLPGPYVKDTLAKIDEVGLYEMIHKYDDHRAQWICVAAYIEPEIEPLLFEGIVDGTIVDPKGHFQRRKFGFDPIFLPVGCTRTLGEMSLEERSLYSARRLALLKLKHFLENKL